MTEAPTSDQAVLHVYLRDQARGKFLSTRPAGRETAEKLERISEAPGDLIVDFEGIEAATPPYLQEVVNAIAHIVTANPDGRIVLAAHLNEDLAETLRFVNARTKRTLAYTHGKNEVDLLEARPKLAETLSAAQKLKPFFTAPELARKLEINDDTATQRLKKLVGTGAAERRDDPAATHGIRHLYRVARPELLRKAKRGARPKRTARKPVAA